MSNNRVYDKSKYHLETIKELGLPEDHAGHLATFFLSWLIKNKLTSDWFERTDRRKLKLYRAGKISINVLYDQTYDGCLLSGMLTDEGNAFATAYFDLLDGRYFSDYKAHLQKGLPSEFHVEYTQENEQLIHGVIDERFSAWKRHDIV